MLLPRKDRDRAVLDQIQRLFGPFAKVEEHIEIVEQIWKVSDASRDAGRS